MLFRTCEVENKFLQYIREGGVSQEGSLVYK